VRRRCERVHSPEVDHRDFITMNTKNRAVVLVKGAMGDDVVKRATKTSDSISAETIASQAMSRGTGGVKERQ
jgi:hypothetical protein